MNLDDLDLFAAVLAQVEQLYVDDKGRDDLIKAALNGMLESLDPATVYLPPQEYENFLGEIRGHYAGIGVRIEGHTKGLEVIEIFDASPALDAGLEVGDIITSVNGVATVGFDPGEISITIRGPVGTTVSVTVLRGEATEELEILRALVHPPALESRWLDKGVAWIQVFEFQEGAAEELNRTLKTYQRQGLQGLVLDLRGNPGGSLEEAISMADLFVADGILVSTKGRDGREAVERANRRGTFRGLPTVVIVDEMSASASEILAGALRDNHAGTVVGATSFGKGTVQQIFSLPNGGGLKLTVARYFLPSGSTIDQVGISPDFPIAVCALDTLPASTQPDAGMDFVASGTILLADIEKPLLEDLCLNGARGILELGFPNELDPTGKRTKLEETP